MKIAFIIVPLLVLSGGCGTLKKNMPIRRANEVNRNKSEVIGQSCGEAAVLAMMLRFGKTSEDGLKLAHRTLLDVLSEDGLEPETLEVVLLRDLHGKAKPDDAAVPAAAQMLHDSALDIVTKYEEQKDTDFDEFLKDYRLGMEAAIARYWVLQQNGGT
jgi:hypothetical protein